MDEIISYKMCAVKVRNAKLRNYLNNDYFRKWAFSVLVQCYCRTKPELRMANDVIPWVNKTTLDEDT
jgi:hypothetical protein